MHVSLPDSVKLLPYYLKQKGYFTGNMLKTHYGPAGERQFQWYSNRLQDFKTFLDSASHSPFFMWVGFKDPHRPYDRSQYKTPFDPAKVIVPPYLADTPETRQDLANYYSEIIRLDESIGWMLTELEKRNLRENTMIVFVSDNGAPFPGAKGTLYDAGIGTPLILNWQKELKSGKTYDRLVSSIDLAPTVLEVAGIKPPADMPGKSLIGIISDNQDYSRKYAFSERNWHGADEHIRSVRTLEYKFIANAFEHLPHGSPSDIVESPSWLDLYTLKDQRKLTSAQGRLFKYPRPVEELYDVRTDPYEMKNLASDPRYAGIVKEMRDALHQWSLSSDDVAPTDNPKVDKTDRFTGKVTAVAKPSSGNDENNLKE
jgi:arylsulfatase A-like enzyme